jgi:arylsulfatase
MVETVVLLTVDALAAGHVGLMGYERETTPRLDERVAEGAWFTDCIAQSSHTRESMPSLFYSAYPFSLGDVGPVPDDQPTLTTVLSEAGFQTAGFHSNPYLSRAYGFDRGFDVFDDALPLGRNRLGVFAHRIANYLRTRPYTRADELNRKGLDWLNRTEGERFLWLHYMDPHGPYQPPAEHQRVFHDETVSAGRAKDLWRKSVDEPNTLTEAERATLVDLYDAEIRYTDEMLDAFLTDLAARDLGETLVVLGADHGDLFGEHRRFGHPRHLFEELIHVPLLLFGDSVEPGRREQVVENVDIAPTILELTGIDTPATFVGESLPGTSPGEMGERDDEGLPYAFAEAHGEGEEEGVERFAVRTTRFKYGLERDGDGERRRLYNLHAEGESTDVADSHPEVESRLRRVLDDHVEAVKRNAPAGDREEVDDAVEDRLRELGYR